MDYCPLLLWLSWWRIHLQCRRPGFYPWVGKIPRRREWLPTPVFWPGEFHGLCSPWVCKELHMTERVSLSLSQPWIGSCKAHQKPSCNFTLFFTEGLRKRGLLYTLPSPTPTPHRKKPTIQLGIGLWLLESIGHGLVWRLLRVLPPWCWPVPSCWHHLTSPRWEGFLDKVPLPGSRPHLQNTTISTNATRSLEKIGLLIIKHMILSTLFIQEGRFCFMWPRSSSKCCFFHCPEQALLKLI